MKEKPGFWNRELTREEKFGMRISLGVHVLVILLAWLIMSSPPQQDRVALMEVTLGEFREGAPARQAPEPVEQTEVEPDPEPVEDTPQPTPPPQPQPREEVARPVELPDQPEPVVSEDVVVTPQTEVVRPEAVDPVPQEPERPEPEIEPEPEPEPEPRPRRGSLISGDPTERTNQPAAEAGTARDDDRSAPYLLEWEGTIGRQAQVNPLPNYTVDVEAVITVRFAVRPDGTVGSVTPVRRTDPDLENEVIRTLRTWRFNRLPSGVPQENQYGTVTFRFVLD
jgi:TonB family protein